MPGFTRASIRNVWHPGLTMHPRIIIIAGSQISVDLPGSTPENGGGATPMMV